MLHLDSTLSQSEVQADMGVLATQAIPLEFRPWEGGAELPGLPSVSFSPVTALIMLLPLINVD